MRYILTIALAFLFIGSSAQTADLQQDGIHLLHRLKRDTKVIPVGAKVVLSIEGEKVKGVLDGVGEKEISVDGTRYRLRDITWIGVRTKWTKVLGITLATAGLCLTTAGIIYVASAGGLGFLSTGLITGAGLGMSAISIPLLTEGKRHYLDSDWKVMPPG
ncbi:MAG: hypothetical protein HKN79_11745 [Flavobacteriales bacterium]|nr:hypothetical protein [Flavobacteriales bacterium]